MRKLYISSSGELKRKNNTFFLKTSENEDYIPVKNIDDIFIFSNIELNSSSLKLADRNNINLHFFDYYENYIGSFLGRRHRNSGEVLVEQVRNYIDYEKRLKVAQAITKESLEALIYNLKHYRRDFSREKARIGEYIERIEASKSIEELRSLEANARRVYYRIFDQLISNPDFKFEKRSKRPAKNNLNTMISFGNSLLYASILNEISKTGLDYRIGYVHENNRRGYNLNLDIADIFKPLIVDRLIIRMVNLKIISTRDFYRKDGGVYLNKNGIRKFLEGYNDQLGKTMKLENGSLSYESLILKKLQKLERDLMNSNFGG